MPLVLDLVDSTTMPQNNEEHDAARYTRKMINLVLATPNGGCSNMLMVGNTVAEQLVVLDLAEATYPWMLKQLGICYDCNNIMKIVYTILTVNKVLAETLEAVE